MNNQLYYNIDCPELEGNRIETLKDSIHKWCLSPKLIELVNKFNEKVPENYDTFDLVKWYASFSENWDFRGKQKNAYDKKTNENARWLIQDDFLTDEQRAATLEASWELGLIGRTEPKYNKYDYFLVLGGARLSCLLRMRLAKNLIKNSMPSKAIVSLGSMRLVSDSERDATNLYAPNAQTEFDLMVAAANLEFGVSSDYKDEKELGNSNSNSNWIIRKYMINNGNMPLDILSAPSLDPENRRANTVDTYEFFIKKYNVAKQSKILLLTSQIYVPYQQMEAIRTIALRHDLIVDAVGFPHDWGGGMNAMSSYGNYLQEIRSTIQSFERFFDGN